MKVVTVIGARPQFIKAACLSRELRKYHQEILIHTGQHYDDEMSNVFFRELDISEPDYNLKIGSGYHGAQTGAMLAGIEDVLIREAPELLLVYGDTNSTLAGALAAAKLQIPIAHVEAGLRSFNRAMPEETNRVLTDHLSRWLFAPSESSRENLIHEGITEGVYVVGDITFNAVMLYTSKARETSPYPNVLGLNAKEYYLCTVHRPENTDNPENLSNIIFTLGNQDKPVLFPVHPRTGKKIAEYGFALPDNFIVTNPLGYLDMLSCMSSSSVIFTDSGGIQKEAYYLEVPCITMRRETEWIETVETRWNIVTNVEPIAILSALESFSSGMPPHPPLYSYGNTTHQIIEILDIVTPHD